MVKWRMVEWIGHWQVVLVVTGGGAGGHGKGDAVADHAA